MDIYVAIYIYLICLFFYIERGEKERVTTFKEIVYFHENAPIHIHLGLWEYNNNIITMISSWNCISWPPLTLFICVYIYGSNIVPFTHVEKVTAKPIQNNINVVEYYYVRKRKQGIVFFRRGNERTGLGWAGRSSHINGIDTTIFPPDRLPFSSIDIKWHVSADE